MPTQPGMTDITGSPLPAETPAASHSKPCTLCSKLCDVRIRCQIDESGKWHFVCPGKCWKRVSGGIVDGDGAPSHQYYRYGGVWKNKHEAVSGKKPKKKPLVDEKDLAGQTSGPEWSGDGVKYTKNDRVLWADEAWVCRKSHASVADKPPSKTPNLWKEAVGWREE